MLDEPTWKKRGCGTSVLAGLAILAAVVLMSMPAWVMLL